MRRPCLYELGSTGLDGWVGSRCAPRSTTPRFRFVHINELKGGAETAAHLLEFDSVHGRWRVPIAAEAQRAQSSRPAHRLTATCDAPGEVPWEQAGGRNRARMLGQISDAGGVAAVFRAGRAQSDRRGAGQAGRAQCRDGRQRSACTTPIGTTSSPRPPAPPIAWRRWSK